MVKGKNQKQDNEESIKNLLIILLLKNGASAKAIEAATGIDQKTIRNKFPKSLLGKSD
jgi:hypothetical protein